MQKVGRNDPCPCGSGKKFKKCCEEKVARKKFDAQILSSGGQENKAQKISSSFFQRLAPPTKPPEEIPKDEDTVM